MIEVMKSLSKKKIFYILIMLQFIFSLVYFFVIAAAIQSAFYININVPRQLDISTEQLIHIEVDVFEEKSNFNNFVADIESQLNGKVGTYESNVINSVELGGDVGTVEIDSNIVLMKELEIEQGTYFDYSDFKYNIMISDEDNPVSILIGSELAKEYGVEIGDEVYDLDNSQSFVVKGILKPGSKWFADTVDEGSIADLGYEVIVPRSESDYIHVHYYCIMPEQVDIDDTIKQIKQLAEKNSVTMEAEFVSDELAVKFSESLEENKNWMIFVVVMMIMISVGTASLFMAQMKSRKHEIGIKVAVGYSCKKIIKMLFGEVLVVATVAFSIAAILGKVMLGQVEQPSIWGQGTYVDGYYISADILIMGAVILMIMCVPAVVLLGVKTKRLQPRELIGGNE